MYTNTTISNTGQLPLLLREESFGGIVFDPFDATMLELDHEAFEVAKALTHGSRFLFGSKRRAMFKTLKNELHYDSARKVRLITTPDTQCATNTKIPVLHAPTLVDFQITTRCEMGCPHCYAEAAQTGKDVAWNDIKRVIDQMADCGVCQLAVGGGEPLLHPQIIDLLAYAHTKGIVPNLTTSGMAFDEKKLIALKNYCGAVGVSMEGVGEKYRKVRGQPFSFFTNALDILRSHQIPTVIQITLSKDNFHQLDEMTTFCLEQPDLYGVIFLAYKPVGRGRTYSEPLATLDVDVVTKGLSQAFKRLSTRMRVGYDCCMTPAVAGVEEAQAFADHTSLEGCSGMRGSIGVSTDLDVLPCTFLTDQKMGNLTQQTLDTIWRSTYADTFRQSILDHAAAEAPCTACAKLDYCLAGCPVMNLVNCKHRVDT